MVSLFMEQLINLTDSIFLGHVSPIDLGASALATMYYTAIYMLGFGFSLGVLAVYWTAEQLYVIVLLLLSLGNLKRNNWAKGQI